MEGKSLQEDEEPENFDYCRHSLFTGPKHLPNSLRVLGWSCYPSPTMSSKYAVQICSCFLIFIYCSKSLEGTGTGGIADAGNHQCISGFETNFLR